MKPIDNIILYSIEMLQALSQLNEFHTDEGILY